MNWIVFNWYTDEIWKMNKKYAWNAKWRQSECVSYDNIYGKWIRICVYFFKLSYATHINDRVMK